jgi:hypothetical protein
MTESDTVGVGSVVQLRPDHSEMWGGLLFIVTEVKPWGVQCYTEMGPAEPRKGQAFMRLKWADIEYVGEATWTAHSGDDATKGGAD